MHAYRLNLFKITPLTYSPLLFTGMSLLERSEETT